MAMSPELSATSAPIDAIRSNVVAAHSQEELRRALTDPPPAHSEPLGALLRAIGKLTEIDLKRALAAQSTGARARVGELLLAEKRILEEDLYGALCLKLGVPYVRLAHFDLDPQALAIIPQTVARAYHVLPLMLFRGRLVVAMTDPTRSDLIGALSLLARLTVEPVLAAPHDLAAAMATYYPPFDDADLAAEAERLQPVITEAPTPEAAERLAEQQPIVRLVTNMLHDAIRRGASDLHLRPRDHGVEVLYRIDGSLQHIRNLSRALLPAIVARIKVLGAMDLAEHRAPQDGAIHLTLGEQHVDLRISVMPSIHGEDVVVRVLDRARGLRRIADIGFKANDEARFRGLMNRNQGLVLVTGPTGSGKTTTLYAGLQELNNGDSHIVTVEDPVEYWLDGVAQTQVNGAIGYGFATALRHILRHDPDVIFIGEIRDAATATIAIESALTGHLVLSSLHTNSAVQTTTRLLEMGVEPYLVTTALAGSMAQRLVRRNCPDCVQPERIDADVRRALGVDESEVFFKGVGCNECNGTGYRGRVAVYEILEMSAALREAVRNRASEDVLTALAIREGMTPLTEQALALSRERVISLLEVYRSRLE